MSVPSSQEIDQAVRLADGKAGVTRLLADMLASLNSTPGLESEMALRAEVLLSNLEEAPVAADDWPRFAASRFGLLAAVRYLGQRGHCIISHNGALYLVEDDE